MDRAYLNRINLAETNPRLVSLRAYATAHNIPIVSEDGIRLIDQIIKLRGVKRMLEIGSAIGFSAIYLAMKNDIEILTVEREKDMVELAVKHIQEAGLSDRITVIEGDAHDLAAEEIGEVELIFIDAAKASNTAFFEKFATILAPSGVIVTDNLLFHGMVYKDPEELSVNLRQLMRKVNDFNHFVVSHPGFDSYIYPVGDGMSVSIKKEGER